MRHLRMLVVVTVTLAIAIGVARAWDFVWIDQFGNGLSVGTGGGGGKTDSTGVYVAGSVFGALPGFTGAGSNDAYIRKYTFDGAVAWTRQFGSPAVEFEEGLATDSTGVYVSGRTDGALPGQISAGFSDAFVRKYSSSGGLLWTTQFGTSSFDAVAIGATAALGNFVYVAGPTFGTFPGAPAGLGQDTFVAKLNAQTGAIVWVRQLGVRGLFLSNNDGLAVDTDGIYVASNLLLGPLAGDPQNGLIHKFDFDGNLLWTRSIPGTLACSAFLIGAAANNNALYVVGQANDDFLDDPASCGPGSPVVGLVQKYDSHGTLVWTRRIKAGSRNGHDGFTGAKTVWASDSGVYVAANATRPFPGSVSNAPRSDRSVCPGLLQGNQFADKLTAYVRRYDSDGRVIWTHEFGSNVFDLATGVSTDQTSVYVVGDTSCSIQIDESFSGGNRDTFVLRMGIAPTSIVGRIQVLVGQLETLSDRQDLADGPFTNLVADLEAAQAAIQGHDVAAARQALIDFASQVQVLVNQGKLPGADGLVLVSEANAIAGLL